MRHNNKKNNTSDKRKIHIDSLFKRDYLLTLSTFSLKNNAKIYQKNISHL